MKRTTVNDVESRAYRYLEMGMMAPLASVVLAALPFVFFGGLISWSGGTSGTVNPGVEGAPRLIGAMVLGFIAPTLLLILALVLLSVGGLAVTVAIYFDSVTLVAADIGWEPNPPLFLLLVLFFPPFSFYYLYKRHEYVVDWVDSGRWGAVTAGSVVLSTLLFVGSLVAEIGLGRYGLAMALVSLGVISIAPLPYAIYRDSTYVRLNSGAWQPNPGLFLSGAFVSLLLGPVGYLPLGSYYLYKRRDALQSA